MIVKLPRSCTGQEVLEAFVAAGTFQYSPTERWQARRIGLVYQLEPAKPLGMQQVLRSAGACTRPLYPYKRYFWWGETLWGHSRYAWFHLKSVELAKSYTEVEIEVAYYIDGNKYFDFMAADPTDPLFDPLRPQFERVIVDLFEKLRTEVDIAV